MSQVTITKAKMLKGDKTEIDFTERSSADAKPDECTKKSSNPPRKSFKDAMQNLAIHLGLIGEFIPHSLVDNVAGADPKLTENLHVTGFSISGDDDDAGVIITGHKILKSGKAMGVNTPLTRLNDESENAHPFLDELLEVIETCRDEARGYLNGQYAEDPQQKLALT